MNLTTTLAALLLFFSLGASAQPDAGREAIKQFCGCFEVTFEYAETFPRSEGYQLAKPYHAGAVEYLVLEEETPGKLVLQNILVINDTLLIKHWRQDWEYQPAQLFDFQGNKTWDNVAVRPEAVKGRWSQEVYEVDDSPRYAGAATWIFKDGRMAWENFADAPLPRREYTKRNDYQILRRHNRLSIEDGGWVHEQDNQKVALDGGKERIIVEEKGRNTYRRTDPKRCQTAADFWQKQRWFWNQVRAVWDEWLAKPGAYVLEKMAGEQFLTDELDKLSSEKFKDETEARNAIRKVLDKYRSAAASGNR